MMPSLFISHGSPSTTIEEQSAARHFMMGLAAQLPKPEAILVVSAHWEGRHSMVNAPKKNETIYDFYGFPPKMYQMSYPAPSAPALASKVHELIGSEIVTDRGLDHGAWSPLYLIYPDCDIPVAQLTVEIMQDAQYHYDIGEKLMPLRKEGVMILGSGSCTHNLGDIQFFGKNPSKWAIEYENWFVNAINHNDHTEIIHADERAPHFRHAHPRLEHWLPLYVPMGAAKEKATLLHRGMEHKNLSMASVRFD